MDKKAEINWLAMIFVAIVAIGAVFLYTSAKPATTEQTTLGETGTQGTVGVTAAAEGCAINPSIVTSLTDILNPGTAITGTATYRLNNEYIGTTAPTTKGTVDILYNASGYLNKVKTGVSLGCGANQITDKMYAYTNATLTYYSNNGLSALTYGTVNETAVAAGGTYNWQIRMQGVDKKSTGDQLFIIELSTPANVSSISMNGGTSVTVPNGYARQLTNGYAAAFLLPALVGNIKVDYNLAAAAATGKVISGTVYTTVYSTQPFVETDGTFSQAGFAFNSLNTAKYQDVQTKNFIIV